MAKRGRTSMEALMITDTGLAAIISRPDAPFELDDEEADHWRNVVAAMPADHFIPANYHLLVCLCRHVIESRRITAIVKAYRKQATFNYREYGELLRIQQSQSLIIARLSRSMRLSQQATKNKNMRLPGRITDKPEEW
jgi:zona occludens toxin (predicted ATPase)